MNSPPLAAAGPAPAQTARTPDAGRSFEALMLKQVLQSALPAPEGAAAQWHGLAIDGVATQLASAIPLGLARLLEQPR